MSIKPFFLWRDFWIGFYYDNAKRILYICPVPMFGLRIKFARKPKSTLRINGELKQVCYEDKSIPIRRKEFNRDDPC